MNNDTNRKHSNNFYKKFEALSKHKRTIEQQDNESLNTMDYYNEDNTSKTQNIEEIKHNYKTFSIKKINYKTINKNNNTLKKQLETNNNQNLTKINNNKTIPLSRSFLINKKDKNIQKLFEDNKNDNDYCSKCHSEIEYLTKACPHCLKPLCRKCLKEIFNRNLDNNDDLDNYEQNIINEKKCPNCLNLSSINDYINFNPKEKINILYKLKEPLDSYQNKQNSSINQKEKNVIISNDLEDFNNEYNVLLNKIEEKKKEIEVKKNLNINILQIIQKKIEFEYNNYLKKLNEMSLHLKKVQYSIYEKKNKINKDKNYNNTFELQKIIVEHIKKLNNFSNNIEKLNQRLILRAKPKAFKSYESNLLSFNLSDTYCMKYKEILSNQYIGKTYIKIDRFINNYVNYLNFSILINQNNKEFNDNVNNNLINKPKYVVNIIINNKLFKLNKVNNDSNQICFNYECALEESNIFSSKNQSNLTNNIIKNEELNIKVIVSELFL